MQTSVSSQMPVAVAGLLRDGSLSNRVETARAAAAVAQVSTVTVVTANNTEWYRVVINGVVIEVTSDGSATKPEIQALLIAAINGDANASKFVTASANSTDKVDLTGVVKGASFVVTVDAETGGSLSVATGTTATSTSIPFGRAVVTDSYDSTWDQTNVKLPTTTGQVFFGISMFVQKANPNAVPDSTGDATGDASYVDKEAMAIVRRGLVWVVAEDDVALTDTVYFRQTVNGDMPLGAFTPTNDGETDAVPTAKWRSEGSAGDLVLVEINLP